MQSSHCVANSLVLPRQGPDAEERGTLTESPATTWGQQAELAATEVAARRRNGRRESSGAETRSPAPGKLSSSGFRLLWRLPEEAQQPCLCGAKSPLSQDLGSRAAPG